MNDSKSKITSLRAKSVSDMSGGSGKSTIMGNKYPKASKIAGMDSKMKLKMPMGMKKSKS